MIKNKFIKYSSILILIILVLFFKYRLIFFDNVSLENPIYKLRLIIYWIFVLILLIIFCIIAIKQVIFFIFTILLCLLIYFSRIPEMIEVLTINLKKNDFVELCNPNYNKINNNNSMICDSFITKNIYKYEIKGKLYLYYSYVSPYGEYCRIEGMGFLYCPNSYKNEFENSISIKFKKIFYTNNWLFIDGKH